MNSPVTPENVGESLERLRIADYYTSLLHVSGADLSVLPKNDVYTGGGKITGLALSAVGDSVIINRYIEPKGFNYVTEWLDAFYPINSILLTVTNDNPGNRIAGTKWALESNGDFLAGVGTGLDNNDPSFVYTFSPGSSGTESGDIAGEYCVKLNTDTLPIHTHDVNPQTLTIGRFNTEKTFCFYFGDTVNPQGLVEQKIWDPGINLVTVGPNRGRAFTASGRSYSYFLEQDRIQAFQNNTTYNGQVNYRTHLIRERHANGYRYTDSDFNPKLANFSLSGWGGSVTGGPGWGGLMVSQGQGDSRFGTNIWISNGFKPVGVPWGSGNEVPILYPPGYSDLDDENTLAGYTGIAAVGYDPRDQDRVHPGIFTPQDLVRARNIIVEALGEEEAAIALQGVNRLREINAVVDEGTYNNLTTEEQIPGTGIRQTRTAGDSLCHNNILPNYGVYVWRRVPLDYTIVEPPTDTTVVVPPPIDTRMWRATITTNKKELNLNQWALDRGWDGQQPATITINNNVYIYSDNIQTPALEINNWSNGLTLINNGYIMGRGGDGGSYGATKQKEQPSPPGGNYWDGWNGGDAINITSTSRIVIQNNNGAIAGGGGGGAGSGTGNFGGGGGGAGGGNGGMGAKEREGIFERGGAGGDIGESGSDGGNWLNRSGNISLGRLRRNFNLQGRGGQAGGGGSGGFQAAGNDPHGGGGGGGRILTNTAAGGDGGEAGGANGGSVNNEGQSASSSEGSRWGNAAGGGGWGADGGDCSRARVSPRTTPKGGKGGNAINSAEGSNYLITGGIVYGKRD
tara:strand:+ start:18648 stop:21035 length:2388 start_codon:yes stop_codon:yes gene_type:complete